MLLAELFHEQASPWRDIAERHVSTVLSQVSKWVNQAISRLFREERLRRDVDAICQQKLEECRAKAFEELDKIATDEERHPITYNHYYTDNIQQARSDSQKVAFGSALSSTICGWSENLTNIKEEAGLQRFLDCLQPRICVDMDQQACEEALAGLNAYYKVM